MDKRKQYSPEEKIGILRKHLPEGAAISDLCDQYGMDPSLFYRRQKELFESGRLVFQKGTGSEKEKLEKKISYLEQKPAKKNEVLSEEEHVALKKTVGRSERLPGTA